MSYLQWDENKRRRLALAEKEASSVVVMIISYKRFRHKINILIAELLYNFQLQIN